MSFKIIGGLALLASVAALDNGVARLPGTFNGFQLLLFH
jgi:hypothetical protein